MPSRLPVVSSLCRIQARGAFSLSALAVATMHLFCCQLATELLPARCQTVVSDGIWQVAKAVPMAIKYAIAELLTC